MRAHGEVAEPTGIPLQMRTVNLPDGIHGVACVSGCCDGLSDEQLVAMAQEFSGDD
jgi:hypothetical protein